MSLFSQKFKRLQSELFIVAMELHEVFILYANTASKAIETSFSAFLISERVIMK
jgi:hypothetical protein